MINKNEETIKIISHKYMWSYSHRAYEGSVGVKGKSTSISSIWIAKDMLLYSYILVMEEQARLCCIIINLLKSMLQHSSKWCVWLHEFIGLRNCTNSRVNGNRCSHITMYQNQRSFPKIFIGHYLHVCA